MLYVVCRNVVDARWANSKIVPLSFIAIFLYENFVKKQNTKVLFDPCVTVMIQSNEKELVLLLLIFVYRSLCGCWITLIINILYKIWFLILMAMIKSRKRTCDICRCKSPKKMFCWKCVRTSTSAGTCGCHFFSYCPHLWYWHRNLTHDPSRVVRVGHCDATAT